MKLGSHTKGSTSRARTRMRAALSACLASALVLVLGGIIFMNGSMTPVDPNAIANPNGSNAPGTPAAEQVAIDANSTAEDAQRNVDLGYVHDELLLSIEPGTTAESINKSLASYDFALTKDVSSQDLDAGFVKIELAEGANVEDSMATLNAAGMNAQPNYLYEIAEGELTEPAAAVSINDTKRGDLWALDSLSAYEAWGIEKGGENDDGTKRENPISVAVIDTGCTVSHIDLRNNIRATYNAKTGSTLDTDVADTNSHGTHVTGIVSAEANNNTGVAGVSYNAGIVAIKATKGGTGKDKDMFESSTLANAYTWLFKPSTEDSSKTNAEYYNVRVINMSVGGKAESNIIDDDVLTRKIKQAYEGVYVQADRTETTHDSILTVTAASNASTDTPVPYVNYPGDYPYCLSVINLQKKDTTWSPTNNVVKRYSGSNYNVDNTHIKNISAPGHSITSTMHLAGQYGSKTGTSMASPYVAGIAALLFSENPELTAEQATKIIYATATDISPTGWDRQTGYGEINAYHALQIVSATLACKDVIEYKNRDSISISYADGTSWETYGSPGDWEWSIDAPDIVEMTVDDDAKSVSLVAIAPGSATITAVFKDVDGNPMPEMTLSKTVTVSPLDISKATITVDESYPYTGSAITPKPEVEMTGTDLIEGVDYTVSYENNIEIGEATVTITGIGNCGNSASATFQIGKADITGAKLASIDPLPYTGQTQTPKPEVTTELFGKATEGVDYTYEYENNINAGTAHIRIVGMGNFAGTTPWVDFTITPIDLARADFGTIDPITFTASAITPTPTVSINGVQLADGTDFTYSYDNNVNASDQARVIIQGIGNYTGTSSTPFTITPHDISDANVGGMDASYAFAGAEITPEFTATHSELGTLDPDSFDVNYEDNFNAGTARVTITGKNNYSGAAFGTFAITPIDLNDATIENIPDQIWRGGAVTPVPTVKAGDVELVPDRDFIVTYENNFDAGDATAIITGNGNSIGRITKPFTIILSIDLSMVSPIGDQPYTGNAIEPGITVATTGMTLKRGEDYSVEFTDNVNVGTATVSIKGINGYAGEATTSFRITPIDISNAAIGPVGSYTFNGSEAKPAPPIDLFGFGELEEGTEYTYEYRNNLNAGSAQLRVVGVGNFTGATDWAACSFNIARRDLSTASISIASHPYTGKPVTPEPTVKIDGKALVNGTDYRVSYYNNVDTGNATAVVEGIGNYRGSKEAKFEISAVIMPDMISIDGVQTYTGSALTPAVTIHDGKTALVEGTDYAIEGYANNVDVGTASVTIVGKGSYSGKASKTFTIKPRSLSNASVSIPTQKHTGSALTPEPTVTLDGFGTLAKDRDYTVSYANNVEIGTGIVTITGKGNFTSFRKVNFAIEGDVPSSPNTPGNTVQSVSMHRLYNPNSGEHFYTSSDAERDNLVNAGWQYEGFGWTAPKISNTPVYRLYNSNAGDHHYTTSTVERDSLLAAGWSDEGIGWYSDDGQHTPLYRQYNPNAVAGSHNYTTSLDEHRQLVSVGWQDEGVSWHGL